MYLFNEVTEKYTYRLHKQRVFLPMRLNSSTQVGFSRICYVTPYIRWAYYLASNACPNTSYGVDGGPWRRLILEAGGGEVTFQLSCTAPHSVGTDQG